MDNQWPLPAPAVGKAFQQAHTPKPEISKPASPAIEEQAKPPPKIMELKPRGMRGSTPDYREQAEMAERMKRSLQERSQREQEARSQDRSQEKGLDAKKGRAQSDFNRSHGL